MWRYLLPAGIFAALLVFLGLGLRLDPSRVPSPLIGKPVPEFTLPNLEDASTNFSSAQLKGQVSLLNVWASWCVSCRTEHAVLLDLARQSTVPIYGLNYKDEREAALSWLRQLGNPYASNAQDLAGRVAIDWGVYGAPETFVVDAQGVIRYKHIGPLTPEFVQSTLLPMLAQLSREAAP